MEIQAEIKVHDAEVLNAIDGACLRGLQQASAFLHRELQKALRTPNREGWWRSQAGEVPHRSQEKAGPSKDVFREVDEKAMEARLGVRGESFHLFFMEVGTRAHTIVPRVKKFLRIPWRGEGRGEREPTAAEIAQLGLVPERGKSFRVHKDSTKAGTKRARATQAVVGGWVYFRERVKHPGTAPRPWMVPTLMAHKQRIVELLTSPLAQYRPNFRTSPGTPPGKSDAA